MMRALEFHYQRGETIRTLPMYYTLNGRYTLCGSKKGIKEGKVIHVNDISGLELIPDHANVIATYDDEEEEDENGNRVSRWIDDGTRRYKYKIGSLGPWFSIQYKDRPSEKLIVYNTSDLINNKLKGIVTAKGNYLILDGSKEVFSVCMNENCCLQMPKQLTDGYIVDKIDFMRSVGKVYGELSKD